MSSSLSEKFPDEIWLTIFNNKELKYQHLKKLTRVSKHFRDLIKSSVFDKTLFRTPIENSPELVKGQKVQLHPVIKSLDFVASDLNGAFLHMRNEYDKEKETRSVEEISTLPCLSEYATFPTTKLVKVVELADGFEVKNNQGVTVMDLLMATINAWNEEDENIYVDEEGFVLGEEDESFGQDRPITRLDNLCARTDHHFWEGWESSSVTSYKKGSLVVSLKPHWFGS